MAATAARRLGRLLLLIGLAVAAYLALCAFDHAARADSGAALGDADPLAPVKKVAADVAPESPAPKVAASRVVRAKAPVTNVARPKASVVRDARPKASVVRDARPKASVVRDARPKASVVRDARPKASVVRVAWPKASTVARIARPEVSASAVVRKAVAIHHARVVRATAASARKAADQQISTLRAAAREVPVRPALTALPGTLPKRSTIIGRPALPDLAGLGSVVLPGVAGLTPPALPSRPDLSAAAYLGLRPGDYRAGDYRALGVNPLPGLIVSARPSALVNTGSSAGTIVAPGAPGSAGTAVAPGAPGSAGTAVAPSAPTSVWASAALSEGWNAGAGAPDAAVREPAVREPDPRAPAFPGPASPPRPGDRSFDAAHLRDAGGGATAAMGVLPSSWRPEISFDDLISTMNAEISGRSVRYSGPPS